jgi:hypothetical protein
MPSDSETWERLEAPAVMLVALDAGLEELCAAALGDSWVRVHKVRHATAACERMPVLMPMIVVAPQALPREDAVALTDRIIAVGAKAIWVTPGLDGDVLLKRLKAAVRRSLKAR